MLSECDREHALSKIAGLCSEDSELKTQDGNAHQECLTHVQRYPKDSMENEPSLTRYREMRKMVQEIIPSINEHADDTHLDNQIVSDFEGKHLKILDKTKEEYILSEPSPYYRDGYNLYLYRWTQKYKTEHLLFLHYIRQVYPCTVTIFLCADKILTVDKNTCK